MPFLNRLRVIIWCWSSRGELRRDRRVQRTETGDGLGLGVVDIKDNEVETAETIAERIELAAGSLGDGRVHFIHPDCGFWMLQRNGGSQDEGEVAGREPVWGRR